MLENCLWREVLSQWIHCDSVANAICTTLTYFELVLFVRVYNYLTYRNTRNKYFELSRYFEIFWKVAIFILY